MIQAIKDQGTPKEQTKKFSEEVWKFMGKNKNGWVQMSESVAKNEAGSKSMPSTGEKGKVTNQVVENDIKKTDDLVKVENTANATANEAADDSRSAPATEEAKLKVAFFALVSENLTKNTIKNYLDDDTVNIPYKVNTMDGLTEILYTHFNGDIAALQASKLFSK
jgi:hypothetical protein